MRTRTPGRAPSRAIPLLLSAALLSAAAFMTACRIAPLQAVATPDLMVAAPEELPTIPPPDPAAAWVPAGYRVNIAVKDLTYPTSVEFDGHGNMFIAEAGYVYGDDAAVARIFRIAPDGHVEIIAEGLNGPITDLLWYNDALYISHRGIISILQSSGEIRDIVTGLPSLGDHHNNQLVAGPNGWLYFGQGTATNSGIVGVDNFIFGWLQVRPEVHDIPPFDIRIRNRQYTTLNPLILAQTGEPPLAFTAPFSPFGQSVRSLERRGEVKANGTILRMRPDGSQLEIFASGLRNPFGLVWGPDTRRPGRYRLYAADNGYDDRGSRPVANAPDVLWEIYQGAWYGWPDFVAGQPINTRRFRPSGKATPQFILASHPPVEQPFMTFGRHDALTKMDVSRHPQFGFVDELFIAQFGDMTPVTGAQLEPFGRRVLRFDPHTRIGEPFFFARPETQGPPLREHVITPGPKRPVDVVFSPRGDALYVVDLGAMMVLPTATPMVRPFPATGVVWRIMRDDAPPPLEASNISVLPPRADPAPGAAGQPVPDQPSSTASVP
jgi:glucose/arabinose dehydrogenase